MSGEDGTEPGARRCEGSGYLEEGQVEGSCSQGGAQGSASWEIKHANTSHRGQNMPTMTVLGEEIQEGREGDTGIQGT